MKSFLSRISVLGAIFMFSTLPTRAAVPGEFNYQGDVRVNGVPMTAAGVSMTFALYNVDTGGNPLHSEAKYPQTQC